MSLRLAPGQEPDRVLEQLRAHVEAHVPWGLELRFTALEARRRGRPIRRGPHSMPRSDGCCARGFGAEPVLMGVGGSIPFVGPFADAFGGIPALLLGPSDPHSRIHGENKSLHLGDWRNPSRAKSTCSPSSPMAMRAPRAVVARPEPVLAEFEFLRPRPRNLFENDAPGTTHRTRRLPVKRRRPRVAVIVSN